MSKIWVLYQDMHSGGSRKLDCEAIIVEASSEPEADRLFEEKTGRYPWNITCECCGPDFWSWVHKSLAEAKENCFGGPESLMVLRDD